MTTFSEVPDADLTAMRQAAQAEVTRRFLDLDVAEFVAAGDESGTVAFR